MNTSKKCVAMLLAGGQGSRLGVLTRHRAKPAVQYGGKYRIIDFPLSNCVHSGIDTVGVLTQYQPLELNSYIGTGASWDLDSTTGGAFVLPPYVNSEKGEWYSGTANAIYQNMVFIDRYSPKYIIVLSGDHIYKMDYAKMIAFHEKNEADATIAVIKVPMEEASRFGIMNTDDDLRIVEFEEKPKVPKNNMASMGVYVFNWEVVKRYLIEDEANPESSNDFGKNIIPAMLNGGEKLFAFPFEGYWKDVGTVDSLWNANMDLLADNPDLDLSDSSWRIYSRNPNMPPQYVADSAVIKRSMITEGCSVYGEVNNSVLFAGVTVEEGAVVEDSIIMTGVTVKKGSVIKRAIVDENTFIGENAVVGEKDGEIVVIGSDTKVEDGAAIEAGVMIDPNSVIGK